MNERQPESQASNGAKIIRIALGIAILIAILCLVDLPTFVHTLAELSPVYFAVMLATAALGRFLRAWKWNVLLRARGIRISTWQALRMSFIAHFTGAWTPGQIGGDAYRLYALREFRKTDVVLSTLLIERYAGLCAVSFFVIIGLPVSFPYLYRGSPWLIPVLLALILLVVAVIPCLFSRRLLAWTLRRVPQLRGTSLEAKMRSFYVTVASYKNHRGALVVFTVAAMTEVLSYFVLNYFSAKALGLNVSLWYFLFAMPIVHLFLRIPISFQAMGIQEGCFAYAMVLHGFQPAQGLAVSVVQRALEWIIAIVPGGLLLWLTQGPSPYDLPATSEN